ncbi:MAG TPA: preprotein translocase subunit YajC [Myxococcaceae bacterium]|nr:preprotein translocase subunit YajC [Myxococcaceae bacterium]
MNSTLPALLAQAGGSPLVTVGYLVALFAIMYLLLIRPQQKQAKQHRALLEQLKKGDDVVTQAGLIGRVHTIMDKVVILEIASGVRVRVLKTSIQGRSTGEEPVLTKGDEKKEEK